MYTQEIMHKIDYLLLLHCRYIIKINKLHFRDVYINRHLAASSGITTYEKAERNICVALVHKRIYV